MLVCLVQSSPKVCTSLIFTCWRTLVGKNSKSLFSITFLKEQKTLYYSLKKWQFAINLHFEGQPRCFQPQSLALHGWSLLSTSTCVCSEPRLWWCCTTQHRLTLTNKLQIQYSFDFGLIFARYIFRNLMVAKFFTVPTICYAKPWGLLTHG